MDTPAREAPHEARRFTAIDLLGRRYAVTEFVHRDASRSAYRSYRLDSGEWLNRWDAEGTTLICMRSGTLLRRLAPLPRRLRAAARKTVAGAATPALVCGA